jgi:hypothetical protein
MDLCIGRTSSTLLAGGRKQEQEQAGDVAEHAAL